VSKETLGRLAFAAKVAGCVTETARALVAGCRCVETLREAKEKERMTLGRGAVMAAIEGRLGTLLRGRLGGGPADGPLATLGGFLVLAAIWCAWVYGCLSA
jgi:hypothetical protein